MSFLGLLMLLIPNANAQYYANGDCTTPIATLSAAAAAAANGSIILVDGPAPSNILDDVATVLPARTLTLAPLEPGTCTESTTMRQIIRLSGAGTLITVPVGGNLTLRRMSLSGNDAGQALRVEGTAVVEQSVIQQGSAVYGAGIHAVAGSTLTLADSDVRNNHGIVFGGGLFVEGTAFVSATGTTFFGNTAELGGGIASQASIGITDCEFDANTAEQGGALGLMGPVGTGITATVNDSVFWDNHASSTGRGGAIFLDGTDAFITGGEIGSAARGGNSAWLGGGVYALQGNLDLIGVMVHDNVALVDGGAVATLGADVDVVACDVDRNNARGRGGAMVFDQSVANVASTPFQNNLGIDGGAIASRDSDLTIEGPVLLSLNRASARGGVLFAEDSTVDVLRVVFANNDADRGSTGLSGSGRGGAIWFGDADADDSLLIDEVTFSNNHARSRGGAILAQGTVDILQAEFLTNDADEGGAILHRDGDLTIGQSLGCGASACVDFDGNIADDGTTLFLNGGSTTVMRYVHSQNETLGDSVITDEDLFDPSSIDIRDSVLRRNRVVNGVVRSRAGTLSLTGVTIARNTGIGSATQARGVQAGGNLTINAALIGANTGTGLDVAAAGASLTAACFSIVTSDVPPLVNPINPMFVSSIVPTNPAVINACPGWTEPAINGLTRMPMATMGAIEVAP